MKPHKHILTITLCLLIITQGKTQDTIHLNFIPNIEAPCPDDTLEITIKVDNLYDIKAFQADIIWDETILQYLSNSDKCHADLTTIPNTSYLRLLLNGLFSGTIYAFPNNSALIKIKFKVLKEGITTVETTNYIDIIHTSNGNLPSSVTPAQIITCGELLPLSITQITIQPQNQCTQLHWQVALQENIHQYQVQRSRDGTAYQTIAILSPKQWEGQALHYQYQDCDIQCSTNYYYRLKITEWDETTTYSDLVVGKSDCGRDAPSFTISNPVKDHLQIHLLDKQQTPQEARILDTQGRLLQTHNLSKTNTQALDLSTLPTGIYLLHINGETKKFIKL